MSSLRQQQQRPAHAPQPSESAYSGISAYGAKTPSDTNSPQFSARNMAPSASNGSYLARGESLTSHSATQSSANGSSNHPSGTSASATTASAREPAKASASQISPEQSRAIARTHFDALRAWLARENALGNSSSPRNNARDKLTRLTRQQFQELSTDVYDELVRRMDEAAGRPGDQPFLSVRGEFHPKRNQARQKLATLPLGRFRDLASDVYFELERRYPEFGEDEVPGDDSMNSRYSPPPVPSLSTTNRVANSNNGAPNQGSKVPPPPINTSVPRGGGGGRVPTPTSANANAAANDVVVPNKSTMIVEEAGPSMSNGGDGERDYGNGRRMSGPGSNARPEYGHKTTASYGGNSRPLTSGSDMDREHLSYEDGSPNQAGGRGGPNNDAVGRASQTSSIGTKFIGGYAGSDAGGRRSWEHEDREKVKSDYEYKLTVLQSRMAEIQRENDDMRDALKSRTVDTTRVRELESQVRTHRDRYDDQSSTLQKLRTDFDLLQNSRSREGASSAGSRSEVERLTRERADADDLANELRAEVGSLVDEIRSVNAKYEELLEAREGDLKEKGQLEDEVKTWRRKFEQAKTELRNVKATSQLFVGNIKMETDHMPASSDGLIADVNVTSFQTSIDDLLSAARSKEPTSVLLSVRAVVGAVEKIDADVQAVDPRRLQAFPLADQERLQSLKAKTNATLSNLMTASKNHAMSFGVSPVSLVDAAASHLTSAVVDLVRLLKIRRTTGAAASSSGGSRSIPPALPPIKAGSYSQNDAPRSGGLSARDPNSETSSLRSPRLHDYTGSSNPTLRGFTAPTPDDRDDDRYRQPSPGFSQASSYGHYGASPRVPPASDERARQSAYEQEHAYNTPSAGGNDYRGSVLTYGSPNVNQEERHEGDWEQLKSYLETQTEAIVHSIQSLLTAIRSGAQGEQLNENLTQIITIVSSIVAISKDALPDDSRAEGDEILQDLADNCDKLSGMSQSSTTAVFDKQTKQAMASASFGVAKSLKALNALLDAQPDPMT